MPFNHLILCCSLLFLPSIFPSIRVFSNESALHTRWPKHWSFSFSFRPSNEYSITYLQPSSWQVGIFQALARDRVRTNTGAGFYIVRLKLAISPSVNLRKLKSLSGIIEITSGIFSGHNTVRLDINYRGKKSCKKHKYMRLSSTFLNNEKVTEEIKSEIKKFLETNVSGNMTAPNLWDAADSRGHPLPSRGTSLLAELVQNPRCSTLSVCRSESPCSDSRASCLPPPIPLRSCLLVSCSGHR